jgi:multidrug resistance efflux pump
VDGYLTKVNTSQGAYVPAGQQLLALVDLHSFWVAAYFKETQLPAIKPTRPVKITLMGYPANPFGGKINSVAWGIFIADGSGGTAAGCCRLSAKRRLNKASRTIPGKGGHHG